MHTKGAALAASLELHSRFHQSYARYVSKLASLCLLHKFANFDTYAVVSAITQQHLPENERRHHCVSMSQKSILLKGDSAFVTLRSLLKSGQMTLI